MRCVAAAATDYTGKAAAAISISAPVPRMRDERIDALADEILAVRAKLSSELGGKP